MLCKSAAVPQLLTLSTEFIEVLKGIARRPTTIYSRSRSNMPIRSPEYSTSFSTTEFQHFRKYDVLIDPDLGGRYEDGSDLNALIIVGSNGRNIAPIASLKPQKTVELMHFIDNNAIPKWDMGLEMNRFINDINRFLADGMVLNEAVGRSAQGLEINIRAFALEIIKSRPVLPHLNKFGLKEGALRILGNNGQPVVDGISAQERKGAVLDASVFIDNLLPFAPNNTFAVLMSPEGWTGFVDEYGNEVTPHLNSQTLIFWKDQKGQLQGLTLHNDLRRDQAKRVMVNLGVLDGSSEAQTEEEMLVNIVRNPAFLSLPQAYKNPFEYVLDKILEVRGNNDIRLLQQDGSVEIRPVAQIRADIAKFDQLLQGSLREEELITQLRIFILNQAEKIGEASIQRQIADKIRQTILSLTREYLKETNQMNWYQPQTQAKIYRGWDIAVGISDNFSPEIAYLKTRAGCPVSTVGSLRSLTGISLGSIGISMGGGSLFKKGEWHCNNCPVCGEFINCEVRPGENCPNPRCRAVRECN